MGNVIPYRGLEGTEVSQPSNIRVACAQDVFEVIGVEAPPRGGSKWDSDTANDS